MADIIILPGIGNSGASHWQTLWQAAGPAMRRFAPADWDRPDLADWTVALDREIAAGAAPPVLVAHSLACLLIAHARPRIAGAFLVSVPDPASAAFPAEAAGFADPPARRFDFPSLIVASANDPFGTPEYMCARAGDWGCGLVEIGARGHINGSSGLGDWPEGRNLLRAFMAGLG